MDAQLKRGILEAFVLAVLKRGDSYGYQIIKDMSGLMDVSESTLYPILKRLENSECLTVYSIEHNGRLRKFYHITEKGRDKIGEFLESWRGLMDVYNLILEEWQNDKE